MVKNEHVSIVKSVNIAEYSLFLVIFNWYKILSVTSRDNIQKFELQLLHRHWPIRTEAKSKLAPTTVRFNGCISVGYKQ